MYAFTLDIINLIIANLKNLIKIKILKIKMWKVPHFIVIYVANTSGRLDIFNRVLVTFLQNPGWFFLSKTFKSYHKRGAMFRLKFFSCTPSPPHLRKTFSSFSQSLQYLKTMEQSTFVYLLWLTNLKVCSKDVVLTLH